MSNESADAFLDCIMKRPRYDTMIHMGTVFLIVGVAPVVIMWFINSSHTAGTYEMIGIVGAHMLENLLFNFIIFSIVLALYKHHLRDILWMDALTGYARSYRHDVSKLESIMLEFDDRSIDKAIKLMRIYIAALIAVTILQAVFVSVHEMDINTCIRIMIAYMLMMLVMLCISTCYQFKKLRRYDRLQHRFENAFYSMMKGELKDISPNAKRIWTRYLWPHVIVMILTVGLYSLLFCFFVVHCMNVHLTTQHRYEGRLMRAIMNKEGAVGVRSVEKDMGRGIDSMFLNYFRSY